MSALSAPARPFDRAATLRAAEWAYLASVVLGWAIFVVCRGEDRAWDFRNYHWYIPYAFLHGRMAIDVAVAHQATFYNPFLDIPFYWLATHTHSWIALGILGAVQGANIVPLYLIMRSIFEIENVLASLVLSALCMTGSLTLYLAGTTYYDNVMSVFVLSGLALVIVQRERLRVGPLWTGALIAFGGGVLVGSAVGLKLPEAPFALGFAAALATLPGDAKHRATRLLGGGLGGAIGVAIFAGYWFVKMAHLTGNPLFPYFNQFFHSPLALTASYRDVRFIPTHLKTELLFPLLFSIDWGVADDLPFHDIRVGVAYVLVIASLVMALFVRRKEPHIVKSDATWALIAFVAISYVAWLKIFGIYRYILLLEIMAPLIIVVAIDLWPLSLRTRGSLIGVALLGVLVFTHVDLSQRAPVGDPYIQVTIPPIAHPQKTMILMTGETPMGFLAPSFPPEIPVVRIDGWMIAPKDGSRLTADTKKRVAAFRGDLYVVFNSFEAARNKDALQDYGLAIVPARCRDIVTNLAGPYAFCPLTKAPTTTP
ncbi:MAG TPA: hypothetical protein VMU22_09505 [Rhizomicrobium sp.]|nr:hypothetical protein [Rhizomicrobium sp.]